MSELSRTLSRSKAALARDFTGQPHRCSFQPIARITSDPTEMVGYHDRIPWSDTMIGVVLLAALLLVALAIYVAVGRKPASEAPRGNDQTRDDDAIIASPDPGDAAFDAAFAKHIAPHTDKYFSTRIASASDKNAEGGRRRAVIEECEPMELLRLDLDPNHPTDPQAIAVKRVDGSQLGYLQRRVANDLHRDAGEPVSWSAIFKQADRHPTTEEVVGAIIVLTRSKLESEDA
jgi:HIRAN domain